MRYNVIKELAIIAVVASIVSCSTPSIYRQCDGATWGTTFHITYKSGTDLCDSIHNVMREVEMSLSPFNDSSLISRINRGETVVADSMLKTVFLKSQDINIRSNGMFDPTVSPMINMWGFGYKKSTGTPSKAKIDSMLLTIGIDKCQLRSDGTISKPHPNTEFNFSAITKGYGCDMIAEMFKRNGCNDYMIEIGGEIVVGGKNSHNSLWRIMIDTPIENDTAIVHERMAVIELTNRCGIATSGNYRNYRLTNNGRVWHTIDPTTGYPINSLTLSATVIAPTAMEADALATACMTLSVDNAMMMIEEYPNASALLITADSITRKWNLHRTSRFPGLQ